MKKVSIIMPTYNRGYIISNAIKSVLRQIYKNWELIIVDDGSTDDTLSKVSEFVDDRIKYISYEKNRGGNYARNLGMKNSTGEYIAFLDSDNEWNSDYLEKQLKCFDEAEVDFVFARALIIHSNYTIVFPMVSGEDLKTEEKMIEQSMYESIFDTNVCMLKRIVYECSSGFDEQLKKLQDWEYFFRLLSEQKYRFRFNDEVLCTNYIQEDSIGINNSLYWDSRLYIFKSHIELCRSRKLAVDVLKHMFTNWNMQYISCKDSEKLFSILNSEEKAALCKMYYNIYYESIWNYNLAMKNEQIIKLQKKWIQELHRGHSTINYFHNHHIKRVCIYGFGVLGSLLYEELKDSDIEVSCVIDANMKSDEVFVCTLEEVDSFECDIIVITAVAAFDEISEMLRKKTNVESISIKEIIESL